MILDPDHWKISNVHFFLNRDSHFSELMQGLSPALFSQTENTINYTYLHIPHASQPYPSIYICTQTYPSIPNYIHTHLYSTIPIDAQPYPSILMYTKPCPYPSILNHTHPSQLYTYRYIPNYTYRCPTISIHTNIYTQIIPIWSTNMEQKVH